MNSGTTEIANRSEANDEAAGGYAQLLSLLAADEHEASRLYVVLRSKLVMYFAGRRLSPADDLADEVLHRTAQKIAVGEKVDDINRYVYGIARFVRLETYRKREIGSIDDLTAADGPKRTPEKLRVETIQFDDGHGTVMERCLGECLGKLPGENRELLLHYYAADERRGTHVEQRRALADRLGKSAGALQKQICLLRQKVGNCAQQCVDQG